MPEARSFFVAANWKMHKSPKEAVEFLQALLPQTVRRPANNQLIFFLPALDLWAAREVLIANKVGWGAQNCYSASKGAFTGENSPAVLKEIGTTHALVGHSERRALFGETDADTALKVRALQDVGLIPLLCVGETLAEREAGQTDAVITRQLRVGLSKCDGAFGLAYEPVWAIGTGKVATPHQANEAHMTLRRVLHELGSEGVIDTSFADRISILYGGSVKPDNATELANEPQIDGFLVGGASLEIATFLPLCLTTP